MFEIEVVRAKLKESLIRAKLIRVFTLRQDKDRENKQTLLFAV